MRVVVLLTDAASGEFIWSDRFEDVADNVFDLNDRLMTHVAAMIAPALRSIEIERAQRKPPSSLSAFELYLQAVPKLRTGLRENQQRIAVAGAGDCTGCVLRRRLCAGRPVLSIPAFMGWVPLNGIAAGTGGWICAAGRRDRQERFRSTVDGIARHDPFHRRNRSCSGFDRPISRPQSEFFKRLVDELPRPHAFGRV